MQPVLAREEGCGLHWLMEGAPHAFSSSRSSGGALQGGAVCGFAHGACLINCSNPELVSTFQRDEMLRGYSVSAWTCSRALVKCLSS